MTRGNEIAREGDTGEAVTASHVVSSPETSPAANPQPAAGAFWQHRWTEARLWTEERDARLKVGWEGGEEKEALRAAINALPGKPITAGYALTGRARLRGYKRPEWFLRAMSRRGGFAGSAWTAERIGYMREAYPRGDDVQAIFDALNAMPGKRIPTCDAVRCWAVENGVFRPAGYGPAAAARTKNETGVWNPARRAKLAELWADGGLSCPQIAAQINAIPGPRDVSANACQRKAWEMDLPARPRGPKPMADRPAKQPRLVLPPRAPKPPKPKAQKQRLGERNTFVFCAQATPPAVTEVPAYDAARPGSVESRVEKAKAMLRRKQDAFDISKATGLPLWRVMALIGQLRMERAA